MRSRDKFWKIIRGWLPRYPLHVHTSLNNLYRRAYARKRWIFFFIICVNLGVIGYVAFFRLFGQPVNKVIYVVYVDDFSIYIDDELVFKDEINSTDLEERGWWNWWDDSRIRVVDDNYHSPPYSIASLHTYDERGRLVGGNLMPSLNFSAGWKTLNFTWCIMVPDSNWAPQESYGSWLFTYVPQDPSRTGFDPVYVGIYWGWNSHREPNLWTEAWFSAGGVRDYHPVTIEFDHWHQLSMVLNNTSKLGGLYLDGGIVCEISLEQVYFEEIEVWWWKP